MSLTIPTLAIADSVDVPGVLVRAGRPAVVARRHHRDLIRRFGRFPHRNAILGRPTSLEELAYLASPQAFQG